MNYSTNCTSSSTSIRASSLGDRRIVIAGLLLELTLELLLDLLLDEDEEECDVSIGSEAFAFYPGVPSPNHRHRFCFVVLIVVLCAVDRDAVARLEVADLRLAALFVHVFGRAWYRLGREIVTTMAMKSP